MVNKLSKNSSYINYLALVTKLENKIIGYISFTKVKLNNLDVLALALLAILPKCQDNAIRTLLINNAHNKAKILGYALILVLGNQDYYKRFNYIVATKSNISCPFVVNPIHYLAFPNKNLTYKGIPIYDKVFYD